jgi:hypothetical protein
MADSYNRFTIVLVRQVLRSSESIMAVLIPRDSCGVNCLCVSIPTVIERYNMM